MPPRDVTRVPLVVPDFGLHGMALVVSLWLVPRGAAVMEGDRIVELLAGGVTIDLEAPVSGRLVVQRVDEDDAVEAGMVVAEIEAAS
jgi:pyruvate/2-oxoglutarate dehydrogenase complex dihydrolipoamide acyltransferase (E2) component